MRVNAAGSNAYKANQNNVNSVQNNAENNQRTNNFKNKKHQKKDGVLVSLNKQLINVKKQLAELEANFTMDREQKKNMKKELTREKGQVESQIMERQLQLMKAEEEKQKRKAEEKEEKKAAERIKIEDEQKLKPNFIKVRDSLSKFKTEHSFSKKLESRVRILEGEIELDEGRGVDVKEKREKLSKMKENIDKLYEKMGESMSKVDDELKKSVKSSTDSKSSDGKVNEENISEKSSADGIKANKKDNGKYKATGINKNHKKKIAKKEDIKYVNTDKVDREIEKIKKQRKELLGKITRLSSSPENAQKLDELRQKLEQLEGEISMKDTEGFRKANAKYF